MHNYDYQRELESVWTHGVRTYRAGIMSADEMFAREQLNFLAFIGQSAQEMFDYAEDFAAGGEPSFGDVAAVADVRRSYFIEVQKRKPSGVVLDPATLPGRGAEAGGIVWLPRILVKARAKLRGELHPSIMFGCGGDRAFLRLCDIHPAEFLRQVWICEDDDKAVVDWVLARAKRA
ncbi:MAG: DUF5069 domain-containing protein [Opitutales bacterium]|jgi:hypothetical protein